MQANEMTVIVAFNKWQPEARSIQDHKSMYFSWTSVSLNIVIDRQKNWDPQIIKKDTVPR